MYFFAQPHEKLRQHLIWTCHAFLFDPPAPATIWDVGSLPWFCCMCRGCQPGQEDPSRFWRNTSWSFHIFLGVWIDGRRGEVASTKNQAPPLPARWCGVTLRHSAPPCSDLRASTAIVSSIWKAQFKSPVTNSTVVLFKTYRRWVHRASLHNVQIHQSSLT